MLRAWLESKLRMQIRSPHNAKQPHAQQLTRLDSQNAPPPLLPPRPLRSLSIFV
jgi:hypothetical protein